MNRVIFILLVSVFLTACIQTPKEKKPCPPGCGEKGAKPCPKNCEPSIASTEKTLAKPGNIQFYMETSGSMAGYLNGGTNFKNVVTDLVATLKGMDKNGLFSIYTVSDKITPYPGDEDKFIKDLALVPMANQKSSEMHKIFKMLSDKVSGNDVVIFTSDCILSFPPADIKKNPRVNIDNAESTLKSFIKTTFEDYRQKGIVVRLYGFTSNFNGTYYDYKNAKTSLNGQQRPYYVWVMGKKESVLAVTNRLGTQPSFTPAKSLDFGFTSNIINDYMIIPSLTANRNYNSTAPYKDISKLNIQKGKDAGEEVWIGVNLADLGKRYDNPESLKADIQFSGNGKVTVAIGEAQAKAQLLGKIKNTRERDKFTNYTHAFRVKIKDMIGSKEVLKFTLPYKADTWYEEWTTMDDSNIKMEAFPQTFAFKHLVNGVKEAYQLNANPNVLEISIPISK